MTQIKVTPERLEQSAKLVLETKNRLEQIHKDLYNQTEYVASMWNGATSQRFYQMFNETKPQMFNVFREFDKIAEELMHAAEKFRNADERYDGNIQEGAMCGKLPPKSDFEKAWDEEKKDLSDAWTGISTGVEDAVTDAWEGLKALGDAETWENMSDAIVNYDETLPAMWNTLSDSYINNFKNGDMESRMHYAAYGVASLLTGFIGDKGLSKAGQAGKVATAANLAKGVSKITDAAGYRNALHILNNFKLNNGNRFAYEGVGGSSVKYELGGAYHEAKDLLNQFAVSKEEYKDLRKRTPNDRVRKNVNTDVPKVDPVYGYEVEKLEADHVVSMKEITEMDGFDTLPREQQIEVLNMDENFVGLGKPTNASKGAKDWSTWPGHPRYGEVPENIRMEMLEREVTARKALRKSIKERLQSIENNS
ncbi:WXG100 family type VII secretion target [Bacillus mycoides]|uniref:WXG100 family type VII secretion target n=1 Tax=Bacillus mycoides TaxID=1405 RepID=UPI0011F00205|nr:WXG100 family type VII secretion target [Bacillus mycoides]QEL86786.1 WXG100 family type VII secretion target [Bacillus mycoides]